MLTKMDGYEQLNNIVIFGTTNRLDMIDPALLRGGPFELEFKIDLPNVQQRFEILKFFTKPLQENKRLASNVTDVVLSQIAQGTTNYSGADLEQLIQCAIDLAIRRVVKVNQRAVPHNELASVLAPRFKTEIIIQTGISQPKPRSCRRIITETADVNLHPSVESKNTTNRELSICTRQVSRLKLPVVAPVPKPCSTRVNEANNAITSTQLIQIKTTLEERINKHPRKAVARRVLSDSEGNIDFDQLLHSLVDLSAQPETGKLLKALTERGPEKPRFLTTRDFEDGSLECAVGMYEPTVYAVTICDLGDVLRYLKKLEDKSDTQLFTDWVKIYPILYSESMDGEQQSVKMETLCSLLIGKEGNMGYSFIGRPDDLTKEELQMNAKLLNEHMAEPIVDNGLVTTKRQITNAKAHKTLLKTKMDSDGLRKPGYVIRNAESHKTLAEIVLDSDGVLKSGHQIRCAASNKTLSEMKLDSDGLLKPGYVIRNAESHKTLSEIVLDSDGVLKSGHQIRLKKVCKRLEENVQRKDGKMRTGQQQSEQKETIEKVEMKK
ncbi:unnamed protein product [Rotaria sp. Silwood1]|nr:unnamed protein product [Rotaria sp. Silwood1]